MTVRFKTDSLRSRNGFRAVFSADCPVLRPGKGALASNRDIAFGTQVTFTCPNGQEFATGQQKILTECQPGGLWSVDYIPDCQGMNQALFYSSVVLALSYRVITHLTRQRSHISLLLSECKLKNLFQRFIPYNNAVICLPAMFAWTCTM